MAEARNPGPGANDLEWALAIERRIYFLLLFACALGWGAYALLTAKSFFPLLVLRALIVGLGLVVVSASALAIPAEGLLYLASARYRLARGATAAPGSARSIWKALAAWCVMLLLSIANGAVRDLTYGRHMDELGAHQLSSACSVLLLGLVMRGYARCCPPASARAAIRLGLGWTALTVAFEFLFFHYVGGHSWSALLANYDVCAGRLWPLVLLWIAIAPYTFHRIGRRR